MDNNDIVVSLKARLATIHERKTSLEKELADLTNDEQHLSMALDSLCQLVCTQSVPEMETEDKTQQPKKTARGRYSAHKIYAYDDRGKMVQMFNSSRQAAAYYGINNSTVLWDINHDCINKELKVWFSYDPNKFPHESAKTIKIYAYDCNDIQCGEYRSVSEVAACFKMTPEQVRSCCKGFPEKDIQIQARGRYFRYA